MRLSYHPFFLFSFVPAVKGKAPQFTDNHTDIHEPFMMLPAYQLMGNMAGETGPGGGWVRACAYRLTGVHVCRTGVVQGFKTSQVFFGTMALVGLRCSMDWDVRGRAYMHVYVPCV